MTRSRILLIGLVLLAAVTAATVTLIAAPGMADTTVPETPGVPTSMGTLQGATRTYRLTASAFTQQIANFPIRTATVWGYNESTPGPTLVAYEGEQMRIVVVNRLPEPTTVHFHGLHQPNSQDGVAGISQPEPIPVGGTFTYEITPRHTGSFSYHSHTKTAEQDLRGLDGMIVVLPRQVPADEQVDRDYVMTLQQFTPPSEGALVNPFPMSFAFSTINGKTGEAAGGSLEIAEGDRVRIRFYNASNLSHSMHLHGHDFTVVSKNGHPVPAGARNEETTQNIAPGDFYEIEFTADNPGNWIWHCHVPHHTSNRMRSGWNGAPVGMTRIFHYQGTEPVRQEYFDYRGEGS